MQSEKIKEIIKKDATLVDSRFLYFSHPNSIPPKIKPTNAKEIPHKKYINPIDIALLGKIKNNVTLSALPPIIHDIMPKQRVIAPTIKERFTSNSLMSWSTRSKNLLILFIAFKKITSKQYMR